jgi:multidrug efflux pump
VDLAANDVRDRVARARGRLPDDVEEPIVAKREADATPIMWIAVSGDAYSQLEISTIAETQMQDRLGKLPGVADAIIAGEKRYAMRVWIDNGRLTAHQLTVADVAAALGRENVDIPSGRVESQDAEFTVRTLGELKTPEDYGALVVARIGEAPVRLRDVARVEAGPEDDRSLVRFNRKTAVGLGIIKQSTANTLDVARVVKDELESMRKTLPEGLRLDIGYDSSLFIDRSLDDVRESILESIILVVIVIYLFLRSFRATIIPALAIPVSLIGTLAILYFCDFSINVLTLMGFTLAIGIVVDDAIVVLENASRLVDEGMPPFEAARRGMDQIAFAVVAATVSVIAVFLPLAFLTDKTGRLFREFGITVAGAVGISGIVALTLSPMLCARILRRHGPESSVKAALARGFDRMASLYARALQPALDRPGLFVLIGVAWVVLGLFLLGWMPREFIPTADRGIVLTFTRAPEGSTLAHTDRYQRMAEDVALSTPGVDRTFSVVALGFGVPGPVNEGGMFTSLEPWEERERSQQEIVDELRGRYFTIPGIFAFPINPSPFSSTFGAQPISLVIQGPDVNQLARYGQEVAQHARAIPGVVNVQTDLHLNKPQLEVQIDRERASDLGVSARDIATTLQILLGGLDLSSFKLGGETYDVVAQLETGERSKPRDLYGLYVHGKGGALVPLASIVSVREAVSPRGLPHFDRLRSATITASLVQGVPLGGALATLRAEAENIVADAPGYHVTFSGESEDFYASGNALTFAYLLALVIIYLVLAAQFESFLHPVTILVAVALSFTGALVSLVLVGGTINLFSQIGLVMLVGLVTKNSILIVEFANQLREQGQDLMSATREASIIRFRPILMTAVSTIAGIIPIALGLGAGGEARAPLGIAVAGGMLFSTMLTFVVVPATYILFERARVRLLGTPSVAAADPRAAA